MSAVNDIVDREERPPYVRFERRSVEDKKKSLEAGHYVGKDVDFALITPPYSKDCVEIPVARWFENQQRYVMNGRTPKAWLDNWKNGYEAYKKGEEIPLNGTPIKTWQAISPAQSKTIVAAGILTVEDLAACNDEGLRRLGMGGRDLISRAKSWVKGSSDIGKLALENSTLLKENEGLKTTIESLEGKVRELQRMLELKEKDIPKETTVDVPRETISAEDILNWDGTPVNEDEMPAELPLADQYYAKFGKKPHWKMKEETIRAKLEE